MPPFPHAVIRARICIITDCGHSIHELGPAWPESLVRFRVQTRREHISSPPAQLNCHVDNLIIWDRRYLEHGVLVRETEGAQTSLYVLGDVRAVRDLGDTDHIRVAKLAKVA